MHYRIKGVTADNQLRELHLEAADEEQARAEASAQGVTPLSLQTTGVPALRRGLGPARFSLLLFSQELLALLTAGQSIVEAIEALLEKESQADKQAVLRRLLAALRDGQRLSTAMAAQRAIFPDLYIGLIQAAEGTSDLPATLRRYIAYQERFDLVRNKLISASIYPAILIIVGGAVTLFLLGYVVPRFAVVYEGSGRPLPWLTTTMLAMGRWTAAHAAGVSLTAVALVLLGLIWGRDFIRRGGLRLILDRLPHVRDQVRTYELSRLYLTLGMLLDGGITAVSALRTVESLMSPTRRTALADARREVESGKAFSEALERHGFTTPISLRMLRTGEASGQLGAMLNQSAAFYDGDVSRFIDRFTRAVEPILMAVIGLVVGVVVVLLYMPIFDLADTLQ
jgi:general secretion pathway protein F